MARSSGKRGRGASDLGGTLTGLLRSTLVQAGVVRDALERGARSGRARLDEALGDVAADRRRSSALAELGEIVLALVRDGEIDLDELPEIRDVVARLERLDAGAAPARELRRSGSPHGAAAAYVEEAEDEEEAEPDDERDDEDDGARGGPRFRDDEDTFVGTPRRKTVPLPLQRFDPAAPARDALEPRRHAQRAQWTERLTPKPPQATQRGGADDDDAGDSLGHHIQAGGDRDRRQAVTQRMRATRPPDDFLDPDDDAPTAAPAQDGTVSSATWRPPSARAPQRVWRPAADVAVAHAKASHVEDDDDDGEPGASEQATTERLRPITAPPRASAAGPRARPEEKTDANADANADATVDAKAQATVDANADATAGASARGAAARQMSPSLMPLAELRTIPDEEPSGSEEPPGRDRARDALTAVTERSPFGSGRGGISFDDDLEDYMHPDDVPRRDPI